jgi:hypothetical protein
MVGAYLAERFSPRIFIPLAVIIAGAASGDSRSGTRLVVRALSIAPIVAFSGALAILNICLAVRRDPSGIAVAGLVALIGVLAAWYSLRTVRTAAGDHLLLSKYSVMVIVVAGERVLDAPVRILCAALGLHLAAWLYEALHDPASPLSIGGQR